ncbi:MAG: hypothetical protein M3O31_14530 [Acidobacteriota bacterium]|nr:hypothetical protein [Acidobacteriota bacterium]
MCQTEKALNENYRVLNDDKLLKLAAEGGLTDEAGQVLSNELSRRNLTFEDAKRRFAPQWLDEAEVGTVGVLVFENGERITAEVTGLNEEGDQLSVKVISSGSASLKGHRSHRDIPLHSIASFQPQPHLMEQWPFSDPCRQRSSRPRILLMSAIFLCTTVGSLPLFLFLIGRPYGLQLASIVSYTLVVVFFTFATTGSRGGKDVPGYKFTCPAVEAQIPQLLWRHLICLVALFVLQTATPSVHPHLPDWWSVRDKKGMAPFDAALFFACFSLAWTQILTNKSLLNRAHRDFSA